ncbi:MAG: hypothetical protein RLZZ127_2506 [Planctomycetota bacterium]|jgi:hydrophobe/amphiphile efflux-1 (HAE1) family protein
MSLTDLCIRRPVLAWVVFISVVIAGGFALSRIGVGLLPELDKPVLRVSLTWTGASPEQVEREVVEPIEEALAQVEGVRRIAAFAERGRGEITVTLGLERDVDAALQEAQSRLAGVVRRLPRDVDPPSISKTNPADEPILRLAMTGPQPLPELTDIARRQVAEALQTVPGVGEVQVWGAAGRTLRVWLDTDRLAAYGLTAADVSRAIARQHREDPGGSVVNGPREATVRIRGEAETVAAIAALPVATRAGPGGVASPIRLGEVADIEDGFDDDRSILRFNGEPGLVIPVRKARGANAVAVVDAVKQALPRIQAGLPSGVGLALQRDETVFVKESLAHLGFEIALAVLLTAIVCRFALGAWGAAVNVLLAIPMSLLGTIAVLWLCGMTLNTFTLLGLALAVGLVVDDAIMVQEAITRRLALGDAPREAASRGTAEIRLAAAASTAAVIAVFAPVLFMDGELGRSFAQFGTALSVAVALSYLEAVTLTPARCALMMRRHHDPEPERPAPGWAVGLVRRPALVLVAALAVTACVAAPASRLGIELSPEVDEGSLMLDLKMPTGAPLEATDDALRRIEDALAADPDVERWVVRGSVGSGWGRISLRRDRSRSQKQVAADLMAAVGPIPEATLDIRGRSQSVMPDAAGGKVDVALVGEDWDQLRRVGRQVERRARETDEIGTAFTDIREPGPEIAVLPDAEACARLGLAVEDVSTTVGTLVGGSRAGRFSVGDRRIDIRLRARADQRQTPQQVGDLLIRAPNGSLIPIRSVAEMQEVTVRPRINRLDRSRSVTVTAYPEAGADQASAQRALDRVVADTASGGVRAVPGDASLAFNQAGAGIGIAFALGLLAAYLVLAAQFESWRHPLTVLAIVPFSAAGAFLSLALAGSTLNAITGIGLLLLMGLAKKNSILLVDCASQLRRQGMGRREAAAAAIARRMRPILMTTVATVAGALPLALGIGPGAEMRQPMAISIIGGIAISTAIALAAIPALWVLIESRRDPAPVPAS